MFKTPSGKPASIANCERSIEAPEKMQKLKYDRQFSLP